MLAADSSRGFVVLSVAAPRVSDQQAVRLQSLKAGPPLARTTYDISNDSERSVPMSAIAVEQGVSFRQLVHHADSLESFISTPQTVLRFRVSGIVDSS